MIEDEPLNIWDDIPITKELALLTICCPEVVSVKIEHKSCVNVTCQKKVLHPYPCEETVICPSTACRREMKVSRCKVNFIAEVTLKDGSAKQTVATVFPATINTMFGMKKGDELEDNLLSKSMILS